jgi:hypothetical protein
LRTHGLLQGACGHTRRGNALKRALETGASGDLATGGDGLIATRIAHTATEQVTLNRARR